MDKQTEYRIEISLQGTSVKTKYLVDGMPCQPIGGNEKYRALLEELGENCSGIVNTHRRTIREGKVEKIVIEFKAD